MAYKIIFDKPNLVDLEDWITINLALGESRLDIPARKKLKHYEQLEIENQTISNGIAKRLATRGYSEESKRWRGMAEDYRRGILTAEQLVETYQEVKISVKSGQQ